VAIMLALLLNLPESPRWLVRNDGRDAAEAGDVGIGSSSMLFLRRLAADSRWGQR
jgi:hypothetical protein